MTIINKKFNNGSIQQPHVFPSRNLPKVLYGNIDSRSLAPAAKKEINSIIHSAIHLPSGKIDEAKLDMMSSLIADKINIGISGAKGITANDIKSMFLTSDVVYPSIKYNEMMQRSFELLQSLATAFNVDEVLKVAAKSIIGTGMSGVRVYLRKIEKGEIKLASSINVLGTSRFLEYKREEGEKRELGYILGNNRRKIYGTYGSEQDKYINLQQRLRFWYIQDREKWPEFGFDKQLLELTRRSFVNFGIYDIKDDVRQADERTEALADLLINMQMEKLLLVNELIDSHAFNEYVNFTDANKIDRKSSEANVLENTLNSVTEFIKMKSKLVLNDIFDMPYTLAKNWAENNGIPCLLDRGNFAYSLYNYVVAQYDLQRDIQTYGDISYVRDNFYCAILRPDLRINAIVLANKHKSNSETGEPKPIFLNTTQREITVEVLSKINDSLSKSLIFNLKSEGFSDFTRFVVDEKIPLNTRIGMTLKKISELFGMSGPDIGASIMLTEKNGKEMTIVEVENKDKRIVGNKVKFGDGIAGNVALTQKPLFIPDVDELKEESPELYQQLRGYAKEGFNSLVCVPMISDEGKTIGVISFDGTRLSADELNISIAVAAMLSLAIRNNSLNIQLKENVAEKTRIAEEMRKLADERLSLSKRLEIMAKTDETTGMLRRGEFEKILIDTINNAKENNTDFSLIMMDIDNFKGINTDYGHKSADLLLIEIAKIIKDIVYGDGHICRYGGDEITILLPNYNKINAIYMAKALRKALEELVVKSLDKQTMKTTTSIGVVSYNEDYLSDVDRPMEQFIDKADKAMYVSKETGKNKVTSFSPEVLKEYMKQKRQKPSE